MLDLDFVAVMFTSQGLCFKIVPQLGVCIAAIANLTIVITSKTSTNL
jgi:hypothetical protein